MRYKNHKKFISDCFAYFFRIFAAQENFHFFFFIPVLLALGIAVYFGMTTEMPIWVGLTCVLISGLTTYYLKNYYIVFLSTLALTIVFVGFSSAQLRTYYLDTNILPNSFGPAGIQGRIVKVTQSETGYKLLLDDLQISRLRADHVPTRLRLHVNSTKQQMKRGQWIEARAMLKPPPQPSSPGSFDFQRFAYFQQIGAIGFSLGDIKILSNEPAGFLGYFDELRSEIQKRINRTFDREEEEPIRALAITFLTGNKQMIDEETHEAVRASGLAHLLAISGLHIGLVASFFFFSVRAILAMIPRIALYYPIKKYAALSAIAAALFFTLLTGGSIPTIRAFIMTAIILTGVLLDRKAISLRTVAWAAIIILLIYPESLLGASFQLSFAAVTALVAYYENKRTDYSQKPALRYIGGVFSSSLIATAATTPFAAYHFNRIALYGIGSNLLAIPLTVFIIMPFGLISLILMPFGLEEFALIPMGWGIDLLTQIAHYTAAIPYAHLSIIAIGEGAIVLMTMGGLLLCLLRAPARGMAFACFMGAGILIAIDKAPDILISPDGKLSAIEKNNGDILVSDLRRASYIRESWLQRWGVNEDAGILIEEDLPCDQQGCLFKHDTGRKIIFNQQAIAFFEDCQKADVLITTLKSPAYCPKPSIIIDANSLQEQGAHALYIDEEGIRFKSVKDVRGQRPWTNYGQ